MYKKLMILFLFAFIALVPGAARGENYRDFQSKRWGYRLKYPTTWNARSMPHSKDLIKADFSSKDRNAGVQLRIYGNKSRDFKKFCTWYVSRFQKDMTSHWGGKMPVIQKKFTNIGPYKGFVVTFDFKRRDGGHYFLKHHVWPKGNQVYLFQSGCPFDKKGPYEKQMDAMARSFRFL